MKLRSVLTLAGLCLLLPCRGLQAQPSLAAQAAAEALFQEGKRLMVEGNHAAACPRLAESHRLDPADGTLLMLAQCHELTGRTATAWTLYSAVLGGSRKNGRVDHARIAQERLNKLDARLTRLTLRASPKAAAVPGLEVRIDDTPFSVASIGVALPLDPGEHQIRATAPGRAAWSTTIRVASSGLIEIEIPELPEAPAAPATAAASSSASLASPPAPPASAPPAPASPQPPATTAAAPSPGSGRTIAAVSVAGVGAASALVGAFFGVRSLSKRSEADHLCPVRECADPHAVSLSRDSLSAGSLSTVFFGVGLVGLGAGAALWLTAPSSTAASSWGVRVAGPSVAVAGTF